MAYAEEQGFDPLIPRNWYSHRLANVMTAKVILKRSIFIYYSKLINN